MGRERCSRCERAVRACLCGELPSAPLPTRTTLILLQHPHEARHKLSTLPVLSKCLSNCHILQGRRFCQGASPLLDFAHANSHSPSFHTLLLFPTPAAQPIASWCDRIGLHPSQDRDSPASDLRNATCLPSCDTGLCDPAAQRCTSFDLPGCHTTSSTDSTTELATVPSSVVDDADIRRRRQEGPNPPLIVLVAIDATWQHANEMLRASTSFLEKFTVPVCLPFDANQEGPCIANLDLIIRKEPFKGCMTTMEAISHCLRAVEPNGVAIHDQLMRVLRRMVQFQVSNIASHKVRMKRQK